jgi:hypothetical protein
MSDPTPDNTGDPAIAWVRDTLDRAVAEITRHGVFEGNFVEARPVWSLPYRAMIGQIRDTRETAAFHWIICGDLPTDHIPSSVAATPRDALRHFSLKWQLGAARYDDPATREAAGMDTLPTDERGAKLAVIAEALYAMAEDDSLWRESGGS